MHGINRIAERDTFAIQELSSFAFQIRMSDEEKLERAAKVQLDQYWGYYEQGDLAAQLRIIPFETYFFGKAMQMGGIASVATWPQYRRRGMVAKLLIHSLKIMKEAGQTVSMLYPFSFAFYRKYGWEINTGFKAYTIESDQLQKIKDDGGKMVRIKHAKQNWAQLDDVYKQYAIKYSGMLHRDEVGWREGTLSNDKLTAIIYYSEADKAEGYMLYHVENREMKVKEFIFITEAARRGMWNFICNHDSMVSQVHIVAAEDDALPFILHDPRIKQEIKPYSMARIVDVLGYMEQIRFAPSSNPSAKDRVFSLDVFDEQAEWNNGQFRVQINAAGLAKVSKIESASQEADLSCDIQSLSAMLTGYQPPLSMYNHGRLTGRKASVQMFQDAIPQQGALLLDFF